MSIGSDNQTLDDMGIDFAMGVFSDAEMADRYGLHIDEIPEVRALPRVRASELRTKRQLSDNGAEVRLAARARAMSVVKTLADMAEDETIPSSARARAGIAVLHFAGSEPVPTDTKTGVTLGLAITTNLDMRTDTPSDVYTIEAKGVELLDDMNDLL